MTINVKSTISELYIFWIDQIRDLLTESNKKCVLTGIPKNILPEVGEYILEEVDQEFAEFYINMMEQLSYSYDYKKRMNLWFKRMIDCAVIKNLIPTNPLKEYFLLEKRRKYPPIVLTTEQLRKVMRVANRTVLKNFFLFALNTGARQFEIENLTWQDVDFESGKIRIANRYVYMSTIIRSCLKDEKERQLCLGIKKTYEEQDVDCASVFIDSNGRSLRFSFNKICKKIADLSQIPSFSFKALRDFYIVTSLRNGGDIVSLAEYLGMKDPESLGKYLPYAIHPYLNSLSTEALVKSKISTLYENYANLQRGIKCQKTTNFI